MNACVVKPHKAGLFSQINKVITCLRMYETVYVDWSQGSPYGECWDDLFEPRPVPYPYPDADVILDYPFYDLTARMAGVLYESTGWGWRQRFHPLWEKLGCRIKPFENAANTGVLVRSEGHRGEQLSDRTQTYDDYARHLPDNAKIWLVAPDEETTEWFQHRFVTWHADLKRNARRSDPDWHLVRPQTKEDAIQVMREVLTLAQCQTIITPISNMATCALIINPDSKHIYLK